MAQMKTPGAYIVGKNSVPYSVVEAATAARGDRDLTGKASRITSMAEFETLSGRAPTMRFDYARPLEVHRIAPVGGRRFITWQSLRQVFDDGGRPHASF